jgi:hypothetical protein
VANFVFYLIFCGEMVLKIFGFGLVNYAKDPYNLFDALVVVLSTIEIILQNLEMSLTNSGNVLLAFRAIRLLRLFKLAKSWKAFRRLLTTIRKTLVDIGYFSLLLLIILFIYTLIGMELYAYRI